MTRTDRVVVVMYRMAICSGEGARLPLAWLYGMHNQKIDAATGVFLGAVSGLRC